MVLLFLLLLLLSRGYNSKAIILMFLRITATIAEKLQHE